jgi:D-alanyl-D-alanine carboxypeptidase (penicillin-binding protein 5/6)
MDSPTAAAAEDSTAAADDAEPPAPPVPPAPPTPPAPPPPPDPRDPERDRRLGVRVVTLIITLCVFVAGWAMLNAPGAALGGGAGGGPGSAAANGGAASSGSATTGSADPTATATAAAETAAAAKLVQQIAGSFTIPGASPALAWPGIGQAAVEVEGVGMLGTSGDTNTAEPIASVAKTMTAYLILKHHPLADGESGPTMTVTAAEAAAYGSEVKEGQSVVKVKAGEQLSERDALEALLLASAGNVAKVLARWDAGSVSAFVTEMNQTAARFGMTHTTYTDPSGLDPGTESTAADQIKLGRIVLQSAAFRKLVAEQSASVPVEGKITNYNTLLGRYGVIGIKTGSTSQAGGCLLFAATVTVGGRTVTLIGTVLGQRLSSGDDILAETLVAAGKLILSSEKALVAATIAVPGKQLAVLHKDGTADLRLGVASALTVVGWPDLTYRLSVSGDASATTLLVSAVGSARKEDAAAAPTASPTVAGTPSTTAPSADGATASAALVPIFSGGAVAEE